MSDYTENNDEQGNDGRARFQAPQSNSTMRSDNVEMVKIMKANCPETSMQKGNR